mmetsp:Transcript_15244/g.33420  ORF Transcript_15244/g.33420 Transcript_15244/m.33420 type:complete len:275 (-) Transcript_15244:119-943(-)
MNLRPPVPATQRASGGRSTATLLLVVMPQHFSECMQLFRFGSSEAQSKSAKTTVVPLATFTTLPLLSMTTKSAASESGLIVSELASSHLLSGVFSSTLSPLASTLEAVWSGTDFQGDSEPVPSPSNVRQGKAQRDTPLSSSTAYTNVVVKSTDVAAVPYMRVQEPNPSTGRIHKASEASAIQTSHKPAPTDTALLAAGSSTCFHSPVLQASLHFQTFPDLSMAQTIPARPTENSVKKPPVETSALGSSNVKLPGVDMTQNSSCSPVCFFSSPFF